MIQGSIKAIKHHFCTTHFNGNKDQNPFRTDNESRKFKTAKVVSKTRKRPGTSSPPCHLPRKNVAKLCSRFLRFVNEYVILIRIITNALSRTKRVSKNLVIILECVNTNLDEGRKRGGRILHENSNTHCCRWRWVDKTLLFVFWGLAVTFCSHFGSNNRWEVFDHAYECKIVNMCNILWRAASKLK